MNKLVLFSFMIISSICFAQEDTLRVLFLGNSYTSVNNLPEVVKNLSDANNKILLTELNTPGGYTLEQHSSNESSLLKIKKGHWDFVVLQEQSQIPTIAFHKENSMYPAAHRLNDSIKKYNPCATTLFYMTWGRKYGGQQCDDAGIYCSPDFADFTHMQDSLETAYWEITNELNAQIAPVGIAWKKAITENDLILHSSDNSHPNYSGTYLAACVFYSTIWNTNNYENSYIGNLNEETAQLLQNIADSIVFHSSNHWNLNINQVQSDFSFEVFNDSVQFNNLSQCILPMEYDWDFDDGENSSLENPSHIYGSSHTYQVQLISQACRNSDTINYDVPIDINTYIESLILDEPIILSPNPVLSQLNITFDTETDYQIEFINHLGKTIQTLDNDFKKHIQISTKDLNNGFYYVRISSMDKLSSSTYKILKI